MFKQLFCKHDYIKIGEHLDSEFAGCMVDIYDAVDLKCSKCGKEKSVNKMFYKEKSSSKPNISLMVSSGAISTGATGPRRSGTSQLDNITNKEWIQSNEDRKFW